MKYLSNVVSLRYFPERCNGCTRCIEVCPREVFKMDHKKARIQDRDLCIECGACANNCEPGAIEVNAGAGCACAILNSLISGGEPCCNTQEKDGQCC